MDYDLAKALCTIGVKPPAAAVTVQSQSQSLPSSEEKRTQNDSVNESASKSQSGDIRGDSLLCKIYAIMISFTSLGNRAFNDLYSL